MNLTPLRLMLRTHLLLNRKTTYADVDIALLECYAEPGRPTAQVALELAQLDDLSLEFAEREDNGQEVWRYRIPVFPADSCSAELHKDCKAQGAEADSLVWMPMRGGSFYMCGLCADTATRSGADYYHGVTVCVNGMRKRWQLDKLNDCLLWLALNRTVMRTQPEGHGFEIAIKELDEEGRNVWSVTKYFEPLQFIDHGDLCLIEMINKLADAQLTRAQARLS